MKQILAGKEVNDGMYGIINDKEALHGTDN